MPYAIIENATLVSTQEKSTPSYAAVVAQYTDKSEVVGVWIENCTIEAVTTALSVGNGSVINIDGSIVNAINDEGTKGYAFRIMGSGGTINVTDTEYVGTIGSSGKIYNTPGIVYVDGVRKFYKLTGTK